MEEECVERWCRAEPCCCCYGPALVCAHCCACAGGTSRHLGRKLADCAAYLATRLRDRIVDWCLCLILGALVVWVILELVRDQTAWLSPALRGSWYAMHAR